MTLGKRMSKMLRSFSFSIIHRQIIHRWGGRSLVSVLWRIERAELVYTYMYDQLAGQVNGNVRESTYVRDLYLAASKWRKIIRIQSETRIIGTQSSQRSQARQYLPKTQISDAAPGVSSGRMRSEAKTKDAYVRPRPRIEYQVEDTGPRLSSSLIRGPHSAHERRLHPDHPPLQLQRWYSKVFKRLTIRNICMKYLCIT